MQTFAIKFTCLSVDRFRSVFVLFHKNIRCVKTQIKEKKKNQFSVG